MLCDSKYSIYLFYSFYKLMQIYKKQYKFKMLIILKILFLHTLTKKLQNVFLLSKEYY